MINIYRSSRPVVFCKKGVLKNFAKFIESTCATVSFLREMLAEGYNLIKKETQEFFREFCEILRAPFTIDYLRWLLKQIQFLRIWQNFLTKTFLFKERQLLISATLSHELDILISQKPQRKVSCTCKIEFFVNQKFVQYIHIRTFKQH